jgi:uncharacterized protein YhfF
MVARVKRATCSLLWSWEFDGERLPQEGDIEIVLDFLNRPVLLLRTTEVEVVAFENVPSEFAAADGEGDLSLEYWQAEHWDFFSQECARIGRQPAASMPHLSGGFWPVNLPLFHGTRDGPVSVGVLMTISFPLKGDPV